MAWITLLATLIGLFVVTASLMLSRSPLVMAGLFGVQWTLDEVRANSDD